MSDSLKALEARLAALEAENKALRDKATSARKVSIRTTKNGFVALSGGNLHGWGVQQTLAGWADIATHMAEVAAYIAEHRDAIVAARKAGLAAEGI